LAAVGLLLALVNLSAIAHGDDKITLAGSLYEAGRQLMRDGKYRQACTKFAESMRLVRSRATLLSFGRCQEKQGKLASAWSAYTQAASSKACSVGNDKYCALARKLAKDVAPRLSRLTIQVPNPVPGLQVMKDGILIGRAGYGVPLAVDPGKHYVEAKAAGYRSWKATVQIGAKAARETIAVPSLARVQPPDRSATKQPEPEPDKGWGPLHYTALAATSVAALAVVVGSVFGIRAISKWKVAEGQCNGEMYCTGLGLDAVDDAQQAATISTVGFVLTGVEAVGAVALWIAATHGQTTPTPKPTGAVWQPRVQPWFSGRAVGLSVGGRF